MRCAREVRAAHGRLARSLNVSCSMPSLRIRLRSPSLRWGSLEEESRRLERGNGLFAAKRARYEAERARRRPMAPLEATESSRRAARSSEPGRSADVDASRLSSAHAGVPQEPLGNGVADRAELQTLQVRTCPGFGTPPPRRRPIANAFCALSCARSSSTRDGRKVRCGSRLCGRQARPASIACSGAFTPTVTISILNSCGGESRSLIAPARWTRRSLQH